MKDHIQLYMRRYDTWAFCFYRADTYVLVQNHTTLIMNSPPNILYNFKRHFICKLVSKSYLYHSWSNNIKFIKKKFEIDFFFLQIRFYDIRSVKSNYIYQQCKKCICLWKKKKKRDQELIINFAYHLIGVTCTWNN